VNNYRSLDLEEEGNTHTVFIFKPDLAEGKKSLKPADLQTKQFSFERGEYRNTL
jgi:hypothetical protein